MKYNEWIQYLLKDIRFWFALFFVIQISTITLPPLEPGSTWRQTDGLMVARNFFEHNSNILYPTVDVAGEKTGIIGCEFPILNYLIYLISLVFGFESWYGRLINLIVSSFGILFLYKLIKNFFGKSSAFNATTVVLASIWFTYCRTNIPDTFGLSLCMGSLYFGIFYLERGKWYRLILFFVLGAFGCLSKISAASILTVLAIPFLLTASTRPRKILISVLSIAIFACVYIWYFIWVPYLNDTYQFYGHFFMGMPFSTGLKELMDRWPDTLKRFYDTPFKYTGFATFLVSLYLVIKKRLWLPFAVFLIPFTVFLFIVIKTGINFLVDAYYVVMFIPPMALIIGCGLSQINNKAIVAFILLVVVVEGIANQWHVLQIRNPQRSLLELESILDKVSKRDDLIAISGHGVGDPTPMYMAHRKGWVFNNNDLTNSENLKNIKNNRCQYVVIIKNLFGNVDIDLPKVFESEQFKIYAMR